MKKIAYIPLSGIEKLEILITNCKKSLSQVKQETGADYILNGGMWNSDGSPCPMLKVNGALLTETWGAYGYGWNNGADIKLESNPGLFENFISVTCLIGPWGSVDKPSYHKDQGGTRGRSAIGIKGGLLCLYCSSDGVDARTPERLRDELASLGWDSAVMLDGGGSSQCDFKGSKITASRKVHNWICVYLKQAANPPEKENTMKKVCLDPGHGLGNANKSPDGSYFEYEFAYDVAARTRDLLTARGVSVTMTRGIDGYPSTTERCQISNNAKVDCFVSFHTNAAAEKGWSDAHGLELYTSQGPVSAPRNVLAGKLLDAFKAAGVTLRTVPSRYCGYDVLVGTNAPAVLIEYGFHTNQGDVVNLKSSAYRDKLAEATAKGICAFLGMSWGASSASDTGDSDLAIVQRRFRFADETMDYLCKYQYADALLERLATSD